MEAEETEAKFLAANFPAECAKYLLKASVLPSSNNSTVRNTNVPRSPSPGVKSAASVLPSSDNSTVLASHLSPSAAPCVKAVSGDNPLCSCIGRASLSILDDGRETSESEFENENDRIEDDFCTRPFVIELYTIDTQHPVISQSYNVQSATSDDVDDASVTKTIRSGVASSKTNVATDVENDDQNTLHVQIDSGAFTSCTNQHLVTTPVIASTAQANV
jgi:hypothetical protein